MLAAIVWVTTNGVWREGSRAWFNGQERQLVGQLLGVEAEGRSGDDWE